MAKDYKQITDAPASSQLPATPQLQALDSNEARKRAMPVATHAPSALDLAAASAPSADPGPYGAVDDGSQKAKEEAAEANRVSVQTERVAREMPADRAAWHAAMRPEKTPYTTVPLRSAYIGEEQNEHRPGHLLTKGLSTLPETGAPLPARARPVVAPPAAAMLPPAQLAASDLGPYDNPYATPGPATERAPTAPSNVKELVEAREAQGHTRAHFEYTGTRYASSAAEYGTDLQAGRLSKNGQAIDSRDAITMNKKDRSERHNFAMDATGAFYTSDPLKEMEATRNVDETGDTPELTAQRHNHSSLVGGAEVAAAGTMKVLDGKVEELHNGSGHYWPDLEHTSQAVSRLVKAGAMSEEDATVGLMNPGKKKDTRLSTRELMASMGEGDWSMAPSPRWVQQGARWEKRAHWDTNEDVASRTEEERLAQLDDKLSPDAAEKITERHKAQGAVLKELKRTTKKTD